LLLEHISVGRNKKYSIVGKIEVSTNEHILIQMNKKMFNQTKILNVIICP